MRSRLAMSLLLLLVPIASQAMAVPQNAELTFARRVEAQRMIERVYHRHRLATRSTFEQAVPDHLLEKKVRLYLKQSRALETLWNTPITAESLARETARIARDTRMPERLRELYAALENDSILVQECLVRPVLADRLVRSFYSHDERFAGGGQTWDEWWHAIQAEIDEMAVRPVARWNGALPEPSSPGGDEWSPAVAMASETCAPVDRWRDDLMGAPPSPRDAHAAVWSGNEMIVWGGRWRANGGRYDPVTDTWRSLSTVNAPPTVASIGAKGVWMGDSALIWTVNDGKQYDPLTDEWSSIDIPPWMVPRQVPSLIWTGSRALVWGGWDQVATLSSGGQYDPGSRTWAPIAAAGAPSARYGHAAVWTGSRMLVWGGQGCVMGMGCFVLGDGASYDPVSDHWDQISTLDSPAARTAETAVWTGNRMVIWGGSGASGELGTGARYDPANDTWAPTTSTNAPSARRGHTAVWAGTEVIVWGGRVPGGPGSFLVTNSGGRYNPNTDVWTALPMLNAPTARLLHSAVWTGNQMVVWGGSDSNGAMTDTGARFDPQAGAWTPTTQGDAPAGRYGHSAVWTGNEMIVWGFPSGGIVRNNGGRYDPALDRWTAIPQSPVPTPRPHSTVVWSGDEMILWGGGENFSSVFNTGGRYDPVADTWVPTSTVNAPSPRTGHSAVWTGSRMIIWGGFNGSTYLDTGSLYDPDTDAWTALPTSGAPTPRYLHGAVWTGSVMIAYGGFEVSTATYVNTGGQYNPSTNKWNPTSTTGAPSPRIGNSVVWSGSRFIVWGGQSDGSPPIDLADGALYDPVDDAWQPMNGAGAPAPRLNHTAVWVNGVMVVWGGKKFGNLDPGTGARYDVSTATWAPLPTGLSAPDWVILNSAVGAGNRMIVWGGARPGGPGVRRGGQYEYISATPDVDVDGAPASCDCDDANVTAWATPGLVGNLDLDPAGALSWTAPSSPGGTTPHYDTLRSTSATDFLGAAVCVDDDGSDTSSLDLQLPAVGSAFYYLVRARNNCPLGQGPVAPGSDGVPRATRACP